MSSRLSITAKDLLLSSIYDRSHLSDTLGHRADIFTYKESEWLGGIPGIFLALVTGANAAANAASMQQIKVIKTHSGSLCHNIDMTNTAYSIYHSYLRAYIYMSLIRGLTCSLLVLFIIR